MENILRESKVCCLLQGVFSEKVVLLGFVEVSLIAQKWSCFCIML